MPLKQFQFLAILITTFFLAGCVSFIDATTSEPIKHDPSKRSFGTYVDDKKINTAIKVNLRKAGPGLEQANINVHTFNAIVLLTGEVPSLELRDQAGKIANESHLVRQVHNELLVQGNPTVFSAANDKWLYTKVRTQLVAHKNVDASRVRVIVENRIVYIMGLLSQEETAIITEIAANTAGVEKVVRVIEYVN